LYYTQPICQTLSADQAEALEEIERTINGKYQWCSVHGEAGTGKSHLLAHVARLYPTAKIVAPTGKAAHVLRQRLGRDAKTIHGLFYRLAEQGIDENTGRKRLVFEKVRPDGSMKGEIVLVDESSMIAAGMAHDLIDSGGTLVLFGDPFQLPPVQGKTYFNEADAMLREVHRQAAGSPIIRQAHSVRTGGFAEEDGPQFRTERFATNDDLLAADIVLCPTRGARHLVNAAKRKLLGLRGQNPMRGEPIMAHANDAELNIWNGGIYETIGCFPNKGIIVIDVDGESVEVSSYRFGEHDDPVNGHPTFSFGYALTVHKSQGSEWNNVLIVDDYQFANRNRWLYTAITRAVESVLIVKKIP
jgi:ATP-dependent exoDNAse (exonuclease V) alpha subunit